MTEMWQQAVKWLNNIGVLPLDSSALNHDARVYDLALTLQDGSVLCNCINKLVPNTIKIIHQKPEKQFLKMQNINAFLSACVNPFGLKQGDLFTAEQLYYASEFILVIQTLSTLSKTALATQAGFRHFPETGKIDDDTEEDAYGNLEDLVGQATSLAESGKNVILFDDEAEEEAEKIYGSIQKVIDLNSQDVYSAMLYTQGNESIYGTGPNGTPDEKRNCVLAELFDTEANYVKVLHNLIDGFQASLSTNPKVISKGDMRIMFSNITEILKAHTDFLADLQVQMKSQTGRIVSECFLRSVASFRCYGIFCCELPDAIEKIKELASKPVTMKILDQAKRDSGQRFPLKDLLNVPMQRILKYPLLLKELIKHTPDQHPDKANLRAAATAIQDLAKYINDTKKDFDALKEMIGSLRQYTGRPLQEYGSLVKDGDFIYRLDVPREKLKTRYIFLFSTAIVVCKSKGVLYHFKNVVEIDSETEVMDYPFWKLSKDEQTSFKSVEFMFAVKTKKGGSEALHIFGNKNSANKKKWIKLIQSHIDAVKDKKAPPPVVAPRGATIVKPSAESSASASSSRSSFPNSRQSSNPLPPLPSQALPPLPSAGAKPAAAKPAYEQWVLGPPPSSPPPVPSPSSSVSPGLPDSGNGLDLGGSSDDFWFAGKMARGKAEKILETLPDGTFLLRESETRLGDYSLSVKYDIVKHIKINQNGNRYDFAPDAKSFLTIQELVEYYERHSLSRHFPGMDTTLQTPFRLAMARRSGSSTAGLGRARSKFAYTARNDDELTFEHGVEIVIESMTEADPGWWRGRLPNGRSGLFPAIYVQKLS